MLLLLTFSHKEYMPGNFDTIECDDMASIRLCNDSLWITKYTSSVCCPGLSDMAHPLTFLHVCCIHSKDDPLQAVMLILRLIGASGWCCWCAMANDRLAASGAGLDPRRPPAPLPPPRLLAPPPSSSTVAVVVRGEARDPGEKEAAQKVNFTVTLKGTKYSHKSEQRVRNKERREIAGAKGKIISLWVKVQCEKLVAPKARERCANELSNRSATRRGCLAVTYTLLAWAWLCSMCVVRLCVKAPSQSFSPPLFSSRIR